MFKDKKDIKILFLFLKEFKIIYLYIKFFLSNIKININNYEFRIK